MIQKKKINEHANKVPTLSDTDTLNDYFRKSGIDSSLTVLVKIRASQLNDCERCTNLHIQQAQWSGETDQRITGLNIWPEIPFYSDEERAALTWTEVLTRFSKRDIKEEFYREVSVYLSIKEIEVLSNAISSINHWKQRKSDKLNHRSI